MKSAKQLREERAAKKAAMQALLKTAKAEERDLTANEETSYDQLKAEFDALGKKIERQQGIEDMEAAEQTGINDKREADKRKKGEAQERKEMQEQFSFTRFIRMASEGRTKFDGVEEEIRLEGVKEMRELGKTSARGLAIPRMFMQKPEERALSVGTANAAGTTVNTEGSSLIPYLEPNTVLNELGVTMLTGLSSNLDLVKQLSGSTANWEGEITTAQETGSTYGRLPITAKRLAAKTVYSRQLLIQSSLSIESEVRMNLENAIGTALEQAALNGSGTGNVPRGIMNYTNILLEELGANGGALTRQKLIKMIRRVKDAKTYNRGSAVNFSFLTTHGIWEYLSNLKVDAGSGRFVWNEDTNRVVGMAARSADLMPGNLTKGTGTDLHAIIFGNFSQLIMAQFGGLDMIVDNITLADEAQVKVVTNSFWDIQPRYEDSFAVIKDVVVA